MRIYQRECEIFSNSYSNRIEIQNNNINRSKIKIRVDDFLIYSSFLYTKIINNYLNDLVLNLHPMRYFLIKLFSFSLNYSILNSKIYIINIFYLLKFKRYFPIYLIFLFTSFSIKIYSFFIVFLHE